MDIALTSIGVIHSPFAEPSKAPIQSSRSTAVGSVEVFSQFAEGLRDLEEFSHIFLLYLIECRKGIACRSNRFSTIRNMASLRRVIHAALTQSDFQLFIFFAWKAIGLISRVWICWITRLCWTSNLTSPNSTSVKMYESDGTAAELISSLF